MRIIEITAYRTNEGKPWVLPVVRQVEKDLASDDAQTHEYLPVLGLESFSDAATRILLGADSPAVLEGRAFGVQTLSGTGALRLAAEFLSRILNYDTFYYSKPTWGKDEEEFCRNLINNVSIDSQKIIDWCS